jgi:hypothetical protein
LPETYLTRDYSQLKKEQFIERIRDYLGYIMTINTADISLTSFPKTSEELVNSSLSHLSFSWKEEEIRD